MITMSNVDTANLQSIDEANRLDLRTASLIAGTVQIIQSDFEIKDYEAEHLAFVLSEPNFFEFWFNGSKHGSYKVFTEHDLPYVWDQLRNVRVDTTNAKIRELFA